MNLQETTDIKRITSFFNHYEVRFNFSLNNVTASIILTDKNTKERMEIRKGSEYSDNIKFLMTKQPKKATGWQASLNGNVVYTGKTETDVLRQINEAGLPVIPFTINEAEIDEI